MSFNVSRNSAIRSFSAIGNSSDMGAATQQEYITKVPNRLGLDDIMTVEQGGFLQKEPPHLILHLRIAGFSDSGEGE
jgi:hypothetical protein